MGTILVWLVVTVYVCARLPWHPGLTPDSQSYMDFDLSRPPGYSWLLSAYAELHGGEGVAALGGLPFLQAGLVAVTLLVFARQVDHLLESRWIGTLPVLAVWVNTSTYESLRWVMSESLFLAAILLGLACALVYARRGNISMLIISAACFGASALARNIGIFLLAIPILLALLEPRRRVTQRFGRSVIAVLAAGLILSAGLVDSQLRHGRLGLGTNGGISLLGKGLLLLRDAPGQDVVLAEAAQRAAAARAAIAAAPNLPSRLRAQAEAYELLRWPSFMPAAAAGWSHWSQGDAAEQNRIALNVARHSIALDPTGYVELVARDWLGLLILPHLWPSAIAGEDSQHPFFAVCHASPDECWAFFTLPIPLLYKLVAILVSLAGFAVSLLVLVTGLSQLWRRGELTATERVMLTSAFALQISLMGTALFEAGLWRYTIQINAINALLLAWLLRGIVDGVACRCGVLVRTRETPPRSSEIAGAGPEKAALPTLSCPLEAARRL
jgi:hypothetical protein